MRRRLRLPTPVLTALLLSATVIFASAPESAVAAPPVGGATVASTPSRQSLAELVDTRTWTSRGGNTFPGAEAPFGMVQWSPDTKPS